MNIVPFETKHIPMARQLSLMAYQQEKQQVPALPMITETPDLQAYADNGMGVAAFQDGLMVGFLCATAPFANAFRSTKATGVFSPMGCHGVVGHDRGRVYGRLYQAAAEKWVKAGAVSHAICLYAHDEEAQRQFFQYGFGMRCADGIRQVSPVVGQTCPGYDLLELPPDDWHRVHPLELALHDHYCQSPFFMHRLPDDLPTFLASSRQENARYFAALQQGQLCAYLKIIGPGETFVADGASYRHVHGAYCLPEHRGHGLYASLLNYVLSVLAKEGITHLGVDFETINPTANAFWRKHFAAYTHSVVRRIDENILSIGGTSHATTVQPPVYRGDRSGSHLHRGFH